MTKNLVLTRILRPVGPQNDNKGKGVNDQR